MRGATLIGSFRHRELRLRVGAANRNAQDPSDPGGAGRETQNAPQAGCGAFCGGGAWRTGGVALSAGCGPG